MTGRTDTQSSLSTGLHKSKRPATTRAPMPRLMRAALDAADRGFRVIPLWPRSKRPAVSKAWQHHATTDTERIQAIWARLPYNVGIACGPSGLLVLDLDRSRGQDPPPSWAGARHGRDVLARLARRAGQPYPSETFSVSTPSGGQHLYFTRPQVPELRNTVGKLGWRLDTRGAGGYVVGAGSVLHSGRYTICDPQPCAPLPPWLLTALTPPPPTPPAPPLGLPVHRANAYTSKVVQDETARVTNAPGGQRHSTLLSAANALGRLVGAGLLERRDAYHALYQSAICHIGVDDFTHAEADRTISDGLDFGAARSSAVRREHQ